MFHDDHDKANNITTGKLYIEHFEGSNMLGKIAVENVNHPGKTTNVDAVKYAAMKKAFLKILPRKSPGLTQKEIMQMVKAHLPQDIFPGGATSGWWAKTVQLDLEAKGVVTRETCKPLRWFRS